MTIPVRELRALTKADIIWLRTNRCRHGHPYLTHYNCYLAEEQRPERIGFIDIEASNLNASFGIILSYCIKELGGKIWWGLIKPSELRSKVKDKKVVEKLLDDMNRFDRMVVYWGKNQRYDLPFIRSRALKHGLRFPEQGELWVNDMYDHVKGKLALHRNRLESACTFLDIPSKGHRLDGEIWLNALTGNKPALNWILEHNKEDVISLETLYERLRPYFKLGRCSI